MLAKDEKDVPTQKKTETICVRFSHKEAEELRFMADALGISLSEFLRAGIIDALEAVDANPALALNEGALALFDPPEGDTPEQSA